MGSPPRSDPAAEPLPAPRISFGNGCTLHVDPATILTTGILFPDAQGRATQALALPNEPGLAGISLLAQTLLLPTATPPFGIDLGNAVRWRVGF